MKNVYDIKKEKGLNFILPLKQSVKTEINKIEEKKVLIIIHLHYVDMVNNYLNYIDNIPKGIDIIFTISNKELKKIIEKRYNGIRNYLIIEKMNRGRDISAFLVVCRKKILEYEFVCFLHDKKEKKDIFKIDIEKWNQCLWENMIGSKEYIDNVLNVFRENPKLGLLAPPFPISDHISFFYDNMWGNDFLLTKELANKMNLTCLIEEEKSPITIGTVFWAKVSALKKLFEVDWQYEDFPEEPLANDGTISHAIERILAYVAQDAGFETGWVMTDRYVGEQMDYIQSVLKKAFDRLGESLDIYYIAELDYYEERLHNLEEFVNKYDCIYIYGAGLLGKKYLRYLKKMGRAPKAFLVSKKNQNINFVQGIPIYEFSDFILEQQSGIIIGAGEQYQKEILETIRKRDPLFNNIYLYQRV